jgi:hypothetical protein
MPLECVRILAHMNKAMIVHMSYYALLHVTLAIHLQTAGGLIHFA